VISNTPISDSTPHNVAELGMLCRRLERELNAANERIKRLEEAGNNLLWNFCPEYTSDLTQEQSDALKQWNQAKESKP
jgi:hypothetical protein